GTLSSTTAAPGGRSVTDSSRLILIMPRQLLSTRGQLRLPYQEQSRGCNQDQTSSHLHRSVGMHRRLPPVLQTASRDTGTSQAVSIRHLQLRSFGLSFHLRRWRDRSPSSCESRALSCLKQFQ